ncbi:competence/damage-inducible protein A [Undibacterium fentianense]|uniref:Competence/damage-inducible protein A n=1 Tax=Undibacterium fentianense TaxID=2828728 RepID=A0A941E7Q2_9BURK|nr:molybdopterin-binding protein [Undibacterium fentianense]MBR7801268.1 competence/damage-inducible protein A [Undibacterium fentianense]
MGFGLIIVGDEILSGKRVDQHLAKVIELLKERGLTLEWAEYVGDNRARIISCLQRSFKGGDVVFSTGGIGATPDDHTRQCAAAALAVPLVLHPEAKRLIQERIVETNSHPEKVVDLNTPDHLHRLKMGEFPEGSAIIPNPFNKIPGFAIRQHYFVPGFPVMAWPMIAWVLDTHYSHLFHQHQYLEKSTLVFEMAESTLTPMMEVLESNYSGIKVFSLPSVGSDTVRRHIELGVKGEPTQVQAAFAEMLNSLTEFGAEFQLI